MGIRKAVLPVAGHGTRVLPATKSIPKELLPVVDRPALQYVVDEALEAGIEHIVFVTGRGKGAIEDYFDEPFAVLLPDVIVRAKPSCLAQMVEAYNKVGGNIVAVDPVPEERVSSYGVIAPKSRDGRLIEMSGMVEKPPREEAPSNLKITGRYILQPEVFALLEDQGKGAGGEIQLTDSMERLMEKQAFYAFEFEGEEFDCGSKAGYFEAVLAHAIENPETSKDARDIIARYASRL